MRAADTDVVVGGSSSEHVDVVHVGVSTRGVVRKVMWGTLFGALVMAGLTFYADARQLGRALGSPDLRYFSGGPSRWPAPTSAAVLALAVLPALRGRSVPWARSARVFLAGFVMSVTPGKLGEVFQVHAALRVGRRAARSDPRPSCWPSASRT
ncbi:MAG: hypothetical protein IPG17_14775 [Sandaracinaceae bacterium]|nr:hypothetical protein [Sandaracinaceae bacterium]